MQKADFLKYCSVERRLSPHSIAAYEFDLLDFKKWLPPRTTIENVSQEHLKSYLGNMVTERGLSTATVRRRLACLRSFFRRLSELNALSDSFGNWRPKLPRRKRLPRALARTESVVLLRSLSISGNERADRESQMQTAFRLIVATGIRVGELCALKISDVSPDCSVIRIHGKGSKDRIAHVADPSLQNALKALINWRRDGARPKTLL